MLMYRNVAIKTAKRLKLNRGQSTYSIHKTLQLSFPVFRSSVAAMLRGPYFAKS